MERELKKKKTISNLPWWKQVSLLFTGLTPNHVDVTRARTQGLGRRELPLLDASVDYPEPSLLS